MPECPFMRDLPKERAKIGEKTLQQHWSGLLWTKPCQKRIEKQDQRLTF